MAKNNNVIEEIQELIQKIKNEYQEEVDFKDLVIKGEGKEKGCEVGCLNIISPRLKNFCRKRFNFPAGVNDHLDYAKSYGTSRFFYRIGLDSEQDCFCLSISDRKWDSFFRSHKEFIEWRKKNPDNLWDNPGEKKPENCSVCGELVLLKDGRMKLWNDECRIIGFNEDGYSMKFSKPFALAHFHPECAEKYFAGREQPNEHDIRIKEKLLRNLDKISLDPVGYLGNAELIRNNEVENSYKRGGNDPVWTAWNDKVRRVEIEGEEINLNELKWEIKLAIKKAIIQEIKQNPQDWKIEESSIYAQPSQNIPDSFKILRHKSGRQHWNVGIIHLNESWKKGKQDWAEIENALKGSNSPVCNEKTETNNLELEWLKNIFQELKIRKITFKNGKLTIEFNNQQTISFENSANQKYQALKKYCQNHNEKEITRERLNIGSNNSSTNSNQNKDNHQLAIGLTCGAGAVILIGMVVYFVRKRKK